MIRRVLVRTLQVPFILLAVYTLTFLLVVGVPGNPFEQGAGRALSPVVEQGLRQRYGMEDNVRFYLRYLGRAIRGDLGQSLYYDNWTCNEIIAAGLPVSAMIGLSALLLAVAGGVGLGTLGAVHRGGPADVLALGLSVVGVCVPAFVTGAVLLVLFSVAIPVLPVGTWGSATDVLRPAAALSLVPMAYIARLTRLGMIEALASDYVRTARAKGLPERTVVLRHALRNALLPVVQYLGPAAASAMTGSFVVERVFNVPGLGVHFVNSVLNRDQMLILATVLVYAALIVFLNLACDVVSTLLDPRAATAGAP